MLISSRQSYTVSIHIIILLFNYLCHIFLKGVHDLLFILFCKRNTYFHITQQKMQYFFNYFFCCILLHSRTKKTPGTLRTFQVHSVSSTWFPQSPYGKAELLFISTCVHTAASVESAKVIVYFDNPLVAVPVTTPPFPPSGVRVSVGQEKL